MGFNFLVRVNYRIHEVRLEVRLTYYEEIPQLLIIINYKFSPETKKYVMSKFPLYH